MFLFLDAEKSKFSFFKRTRIKFLELDDFCTRFSNANSKLP